MLSGAQRGRKPRFWDFGANETGFIFLLAFILAFGGRRFFRPATLLRREKTAAGQDGLHARLLCQRRGFGTRGGEVLSRERFK